MAYVKVLTQEELNQLKEEYIALTTKLKELTEEELKQVTGGMVWDIHVDLKEKLRPGK